MSELASESEAELASGQERWEQRQGLLFLYLPYVLLAVSTVFTAAESLLGKHQNIPALIALTSFAFVWLLVFHRARAEPAEWPRWLVVYHAVYLAVCGLLLVFSPWYGIFAFAGYFQSVDYLTGRWRWVGVVLTGCLMATSQIGGADVAVKVGWPFVLLVGFNVGLAAVFVHYAMKGNERNADQKRALAELAEANAKLAAALEENAGLHEQLLVQAREAGVLDERQRMAREIHDTLAQGLTGIIAQLQAAEQVPDDVATWQRHVANAAALARESLTEARRTVHAVEPAALELARLPEAIGDVARRWSEVHRVAAVLTTTGDARPMHPDVEVALLRIAQEALANVAKHAEATRVGLTLSYMEDLVTLDVRDDGVGFRPEAKRANDSANGGFGLIGMRQRVQRIAGRLEIESEVGAGTAISASVPAIPIEGVSELASERMMQGRVGVSELASERMMQGRVGGR